MKGTETASRDCIPLVKLPVEVGDGIVKAKDVGKLLGERASDGAEREKSA